MMKVLKEPFVQFLLIGAAIFAANALLTDPPSESGYFQITVSEQTVETMRNRLRKNFEKRLSAEEVEAKFEKEMAWYIRREILYREGLERGLDQDDGVVKSRVASKMERFAKEMADSEPFREDELRTYYNENQLLYTKPRRVSFGQVLFGTKERGAEQALADCQEVLERIKAGELTEYAALERLADHDPLVREAFRNVTLDRIKGVFGEGFAEELGRCDQPGVVGPVASKHGYHLVEIREITLEKLKPFEEVRSQIEGRLEYERNEDALNDFYERIKGNYTVIVEDVH